MGDLLAVLNADYPFAVLGFPGALNGWAVLFVLYVVCALFRVRFRG